MTQNWEVVGFIRPLVAFPMAVEVVIRDKNKPEEWFYPDEPGKNIREEMEGFNERVSREQYLGAPTFIRFEDPLPYVPAVWIFLPEEDRLISAAVSRDTFEKYSKVIGSD